MIDGLPTRPRTAEEWARWLAERDPQNPSPKNIGPLGWHWDVGREIAAYAAQQTAALRAEVEALHRERKGEVWYWQGDRYDTPESLSCPVLMEAETVRQMLHERAALVAVTKAAQAWLDHPDRGFPRHLTEAARAIADALAHPAIQQAVKEKE